MPYTLKEMKDAGFYLPRPSSSAELGDLSGGTIRPISDSLRGRLDMVGGGKHKDPSRVDSGVMRSLLEEGLTPQDAAATFTASPRGQDAESRKNGHYGDYLRRTVQHAAGKSPKGDELFLDEDEEQESITGADENNWREFFSTGDELDRTPLEFVVDRMIPEQGITGFGGLSGTAKTYIMMSIAKRILTGGYLWERFKTNQYKVLYLIPESASGPFYERMVRLKIPTNTESFLVRTLSHGPTLPLSGEVMKAAVSGRVVFLDTLIRFMDGKVEQESTDMALLGDLLLSLLRAGAVAVVFAHHAVKSQDNELTLENAFRGSGDIGAILSAAHAVAQLDADKSKTLIQVQCVKARDFDARLPFQLQGKPYINRSGDFRMIKLPGQCHSVQGEKRVVRNQKNDGEIGKILRLLLQGVSQRAIESKLGVSHNNPNYKEARMRYKAEKGESQNASES